MTSPSASSRKALSKIACNRLQKELVEWQVNPPAGFKHKVTDNLQRWVIEVNGAPGTLYSGETYQLQVDFPEHYPMEAPQVIFLPPAPLHPHIYSNGHICLGLKLFLSHFMLFLHPHHIRTTGGVTRSEILTGSEETWLVKPKGKLDIEKIPNSLLIFLNPLFLRPDILYDSWSPAMTQRPADNDRYVKNCKNGRSPKETRWWFHDDKV